MGAYHLRREQSNARWYTWLGEGGEGSKGEEWTLSPEFDAIAELQCPGDEEGNDEDPCGGVPLESLAVKHFTP